MHIHATASHLYSKALIVRTVRQVLRFIRGKFLAALNTRSHASTCLQKRPQHMPDKLLSECNAPQESLGWIKVSCIDPPAVCLGQILIKDTEAC